MTITGYTLFCDDIREEVSGKVTYVGAYHADLNFTGDLPAMLPKIGFGLFLRIPLDRPIQAFELMIFLPHDKGDRPSLTGRIEIPDMPTPPTTPELLDVDQSYMFNGRIVVSPLEIREEGYIRVRANFDGEIVKIGALRLVRQVSTGT